MPRPGPGILARASATLGASVTVAASLRLGGSPWLLRAGGREVVLRVNSAERVGDTRTEIAVTTRMADADPGLTHEVLLARRDAFLTAAPAVLVSR